MGSSVAPSTQDDGADARVTGPRPRPTRSKLPRCGMGPGAGLTGLRCDHDRFLATWPTPPGALGSRGRGVCGFGRGGRRARHWPRGIRTDGTVCRRRTRPPRPDSGRELGLHFRLYGHGRPPGQARATVMSGRLPGAPAGAPNRARSERRTHFVSGSQYRPGELAGAQAHIDRSCTERHQAVHLRPLATLGGRGQTDMKPVLHLLALKGPRGEASRVLPLFALSATGHLGRTPASQATPFADQPPVAGAGGRPADAGAQRPNAGERP